jgi:hypothetical protein
MVFRLLQACTTLLTIIKSEAIMRRESYFWGLILVLLGGLLLLSNLGLLPPQVNVWGLFWPSVLIALGIRALIPVFTSRSSLQREPLSIPLEAATSARVKIRHGAGELRIQSGAAVGSLLDGTFEGGVEQHVSRSVGEANVELRLPDMRLDWMDAQRGLHWNVSLAREIPLVLDLEVGASRNLLDLRDLRVSELRMTTGASASDIEMPEAGTTRAHIRSGAASVDVRIPAGVAARINARGGLAGISVDQNRFPRMHGIYQSPDYDVAQNRVDLDIETGVGSVSVN